MVFSIAEQIAFKHRFPCMKEEGSRKIRLCAPCTATHPLFFMNYALMNKDFIRERIKSRLSTDCHLQSRTSQYIIR